MQDDTWPTGTYAAVVIDPPWDYGPERARIGARRRRNLAADAHYATMTVDELAELPVGGLLEPGGHLWVWITNTGLVEGWHVGLLEAWGVRPVTVLTWVKQGAPTLGRYARGTTEHVVLAVAGWGGVPESPLPGTHFEAGKGAHSVKPACLADMVEDLKPGGPWCELFARQIRLGWDSWGHGYKTEVAS